MKIWAVLYIMGTVGAAVGPLPYDTAECKRRIVELNTVMVGDIWKDANRVRILKEMYPNITTKDVFVACIEADKNPIQNPAK